jgi:hypothetical protein
LGRANRNQVSVKSAGRSRGPFRNLSSPLNRLLFQKLNNAAQDTEQLTAIQAIVPIGILSKTGIVSSGPTTRDAHQRLAGGSGQDGEVGSSAASGSAKRLLFLVIV